MKYIDAEKLKAEIERHIKEVKYAAERFTPNIGFFDAKLSGIYDVLALIDSLQQEQPDMDLEKTIEEEKDHYFAIKNRGFNLDSIDVERIARRFYELGKNSK